MPEALDTAETGIRQPAQQLTLEGLTLVGVDGRAQARLAESWAWENEGRTLRLTLRKGVHLHDGTEFTATVAADALKAAIARPGNQAGYSSFENVTGVRPLSDHEIAIDLSVVSGFLPEDLEVPLGLGPNNIGTGAFRIISSEANQIVLERFDQYYLRRPDINRIVIQSIPTLRTAWADLLRGSVDMVTNVPPDAVEFISNDDVQVVGYPRRFQYIVGFNSRRAPLNVPAVRRALNLAIDREALITNVLQGKASASAGPIWPQHWAFDRSLPGYAHDPALAASLLDAAGFRRLERGNERTQRFRITCLVPADFGLVERVALEVQRQLYNVGVDLQFEVLPISEFTVRVQEGKFEAMLIDMISGPTLGRAHVFWRSAQKFKGMNWFGYENAEAERLFNVLKGTTNETAIRSATSRLQRVFLDDPPALFLAWTQSTRAVRRRFEVVQEPGRDPLYTIWRWTPTTGSGPDSGTN